MGFGSWSGISSFGLVDPKAPNYSGPAARNERYRQALIQSGTNQINAVFGGGPSTAYTIAPQGALDPKTQYYAAGKGGTWVPAGTPSHERHLQQQNLLYQGAPVNYQGFGPDFYAQRAKAYEQFALPQLSQQYQSNYRALQYGLANRGLLGSTSATKQVSDLNRDLGQAKQTIADTGTAQAQATQLQVESARENALQQLYATGDPAGASASAIATAAQARQPSVFTPIANAFSALANQYYMQQLLQQRVGPQPAAGGTSSSLYPYGSTAQAGALPDVTYQGGQ